MEISDIFGKPKLELGKYMLTSDGKALSKFRRELFKILFPQECKLRFGKQNTLNGSVQNLHNMLNGSHVPSKIAE